MSKSRHDLDLDQTMPNVELVRAIFIYYNIKFQVDYFLSYRVHRQTDTQTPRQTDGKTPRHQDAQTDTQTHADAYSIVAVDKPQL